MLTVRGRTTSINVQAVMWLLAELGVAHRRADAGGAFGGLDTPEFAALNPNRLIPVVEDGATVVWETGAILRYLADAYGDGGAFWPREPGPRAHVDRWVDWCRASVAPAFVSGLFHALWRTPEEDRDPAAIARHLAETNRLMAIAEAEISRQGTLAGPAFTLADIAFGVFLYRYFTLPIERPGLPALARWYDGLVRRPAYAAHVMVDYAALRAVRRA